LRVRISMPFQKEWNDPLSAAAKKATALIGSKNNLTMPAGFSCMPAGISGWFCAMQWQAENAADPGEWRRRDQPSHRGMSFGKHICTGPATRCSTCPVLEICQQIGVIEHR